MSPVFGITQAGQSLQTTWARIGQKVDELTAQVEQSDVGDGSFVKTVVELKSLIGNADPPASLRLAITRVR